MFAALPRTVLVFDLDDTLYLERDYACSGYRAVGDWARQMLGRDDIEHRILTLFGEGKRTRLFDEALRQVDIEPRSDLIRQMVDVYRGHKPAIALQPDSERLLAGLGPAAKLALITDGYRKAQENKVEALRLRERGFDPVLVTDAWGRDYWKPHRRAYEAVSAHYGERQHRFVYVADNSTKDFVTPNALGWATVRIARDERIHDLDPPTQAHAAHAQIASLDELPATLDALLRETQAG